MYVVFFGTDRVASRDEVTSYVKENLPPGVAISTLESDRYEPGVVMEMLGAQSLFGGEECVIFDTPSAEEEFQSSVLEVLPEMAASPKRFIVLEGPLLASEKKQYAKHASVMTEYTATKAERFNTFALADALATKDKRRLWVVLVEARQADLKTEEVIGMLWWQLKALRLAARTGSAEEAGMKEFPYGKAKRALSVFGPGEVERLSRQLLELYHDAHAGMRDMDIALERWVLESL